MLCFSALKQIILFCIAHAFAHYIITARSMDVYYIAGIKVDVDRPILFHLGKIRDNSLMSIVVGREIERE